MLQNVPYLEVSDVFVKIGSKVFQLPWTTTNRQDWKAYVASFGRWIFGGGDSDRWEPLGESVAREINNQVVVTWAVTKTLINCCIEGIILPSYLGIVIICNKPL